MNIPLFSKKNKKKRLTYAHVTKMLYFCARILVEKEKADMGSTFTEMTCVGLVAAIVVAGLFGALWLLLVPSSPLRTKRGEKTARKYRTVSLLIVLASALVSVGHLCLLLQSGFRYAPAGMLNPIGMLIAISQAYLFTFACLLLYSDTKVTSRRVLHFALPVLLLYAAYLVCCLVDGDQPVYTTSQWLNALPDSPALICRTLIISCYIVLLILFVRIFYVERRQYRRALTLVADSRASHIDLQWVNVIFYLGLGVGIAALAMFFYTSPWAEIIFDTTVILCYIVIPVLYPHYSETLQYARLMSRDHEVDDADIISDMEQLVTEMQTPDTQSLYGRLCLHIEHDKPYINPACNADTLARTLGTNRTYLSEAVRKATDGSVNSFINAARINEAKQMLLTTDDKLDFIALQCGFASQRSFFRIFHDLTGTTPREYRLSTQQQDTEKQKTVSN